MFVLQEQSDSVSLIAELERFADAWLMGHATPSSSRHVATGSNLPLSLDRVLQLNERYKNELFCQQDSLLDRDSIRTDHDRLYFLDINQTGVVVFALLSGDQDPYVFHDGDIDTPIDRLSNFLVTYALQELMLYPPNEPWDFAAKRYLPRIRSSSGILVDGSSVRLWRRPKLLLLQSPSDYCHVRIVRRLHGILLA